MSSSEVKVAACIPIGALDRYGYQYIWRDALAIQAQAFDKVYLYSTTRQNIGLEINIPNVELVVIDDVLFELDETGVECFSIYKIYNAYNHSLHVAKNEHMDFLFCSAINCYIDDENSHNMRVYLERIKAEGRPFGYFAKAFQLYDKVCYPNSLLPLIANLDFVDDIKIDVDVMEYKGARYGWKGGLQRDFPFYIIDVFGIETLEDFKLKFDWYIKAYMQEWQGKDVFFDAQKEVDKFSKKVSKVVVNESYENKELVKRISQYIVKDSLVRTVPFKSASLPFVLFKSFLLKILSLLGITRFIGNK
ncbi:hypothetical protein MHM98_07260 [Psychrobium sp. MM17-31]|uniref:hypothetical protein n=1 Tax=Psychrobium sp. MM17-31 TaxID=2917758 RepID=UPI001EF47285|nr:hypothetical protein [Psychrobium sp. MM17-31]MCG7531149.1 hypothetical protein [Psychrobium sp. MM17-31]